MATKIKKVTLRAFSINNPKLTSSNSHVFDKIINRLKNSTTTQERCMLLSSEDLNREKDLISNYDDSNSSFIFCTMLRIAPGEDAQHITSDLLKKKLFSMTELETLEVNNTENPTAICKDHYYFFLNNDYLVTNLQGNKTIKNLQTYISWFIQDEFLELTPLVTASESIILSELKDIIVKDPDSVPNPKVVNNNNTTETEVSRKTISLAGNAINYVFNLLKDTESLKETELSQLISAELLIKLRKPRKMSEEDYQKILGAYLKPISDTENVTFKKKNGGSIVSGKELLKHKIVDIDVTETGKLSEPALRQEMVKFLSEL